MAATPLSINRRLVLLPQDPPPIVKLGPWMVRPACRTALARSVEAATSYR